MEVTEGRRLNMLFILSVLSLLCIFSSIILFILAVHVKLSLDARISLLETYDSSAIPIVFAVVGGLNLGQNTTCLVVNQKLKEPKEREKFMKFLLVLLVSGIVLVIVETSTAIAAFVHIGILKDEFGVGVQKAMGAYSVGEGLKREMDYVQIFFRCCGDRTYTDWFKHLWADATPANSEDEMAETSGKQEMAEGMSKFTDQVPFSCCDWHSERPCIHYQVHDNSRHYNYDYQKQTTLYTKGCRHVLVNAYGNVLSNIGLAGFLVAAVQVTILLLLRLLHTSLILADVAGNWTATTDAYLYFQKVDVEAEEKKAVVVDSEGETTDFETTEDDDDKEEGGDNEDDDDEGGDEDTNENYRRYQTRKKNRALKKDTTSKRRARRDRNRNKNPLVYRDQSDSNTTTSAILSSDDDVFEELNGSPSWYHYDNFNNGSGDGGYGNLLGRFKGLFHDNSNYNTPERRSSYSNAKSKNRFPDCEYQSLLKPKKEHPGYFPDDEFDAYYYNMYGGW